MDPSLPKAPFPAPPPFWKHFTTTNAQHLSSLESSHPSSSTTPLPLELTFLRPPPSPPSTAETYPTFSQPNFTHITPILPPSDLLLFDPQVPQNHALLLTRLTKSLLLNFLELITVLSEAPEEYAGRIEAIKRIVVNVHAVINMYRPHQARENVREMLEGMLREGEGEILEGERVRGEVGRFLLEVKGWQEDVVDGGEGLLNGHENAHATEGGRERNGVVDEKRVEEARRLWRLVDEIGNE